MTRTAHELRRRSLQRFPAILKRCHVSRVAGPVPGRDDCACSAPPTLGVAGTSRAATADVIRMIEIGLAAPAVARRLVPSLTQDQDTLPAKPIRCVLRCGYRHERPRWPGRYHSHPSQILTGSRCCSGQCGSHFRNLSRSKALAPVSGRPNGVRGERWLLHRKSFLLGLFGAAGLIKSKSH